MKQIKTVGKRKRAVARATASEGTGIIRVNKLPISSYFSSAYRQLRVEEPSIIAPDAAKKIDIDILVRGGGSMGQADAVRLAIANAIVKFTKDKKIESAFLQYDRHMLIADVRRKEMRKPNDSKARAARQKSYR